MVLMHCLKPEGPAAMRAALSDIAHGIWHLAYWHMACATWRMVHGIWPMAHGNGTWHMRGKRCSTYRSFNDCALHTVRSTLFGAVQATLVRPQEEATTLRCTLYTVHCTLYTVDGKARRCAEMAPVRSLEEAAGLGNKLCTPHCALHIVHSTLFTVHCSCTCYAVYCTLYTVA